MVFYGSGAKYTVGKKILRYEENYVFALGTFALGTLALGTFALGIFALGTLALGTLVLDVMDTFWMISAQCAAH